VKAAIPTAEGGLDLGVLLRTLVPAQFVMEQDTAWSFESLLRDITDEFTAPSRSVVAGGLIPATPTSMCHRIMSCCRVVVRVVYLSMNC
jgi:hypothetical protein